MIALPEEKPPEQKFVDQINKTITNTPAYVGWDFYPVKTQGRITGFGASYQAPPSAKDKTAPPLPKELETAIRQGMKEVGISEFTVRGNHSFVTM